MIKVLRFEDSDKPETITNPPRLSHNQKRKKIRIAA